jgi:hypothetical protein
VPQHFSSFLILNFGLAIAYIKIFIFNFLVALIFDFGIKNHHLLMMDEKKRTKFASFSAISKVFFVSCSHVFAVKIIPKRLLKRIITLNDCHETFFYSFRIV